MNVHNILSKFDLKATSANGIIAKIYWLSKLVTGGCVTRNLFMAKSLMDNIGEKGTLGVLKTMSSFYTFNEISRFV